MLAGLELSQEKTKITHIDEGFDFLGFNVRKYSGKLLINPSKKSVKGFLQEVRVLIKTHRASKTESLIYALNQKPIEGFTPDATEYILGAGNGVVFNTAAITSYPLEVGVPIIDPVSVTPEVWTNPETHVYRFEVTLQSGAPAAAQGLTANAIEFVWKATNT